MRNNEYLEYSVKNDVPNYKLFNGLQFTEEQYRVIENALVAKFTNQQLDYLMHPELPAFQLNEVRYAIMDGIKEPEQLETLLTPNLREWQLDILRVGFANELPMDKITDLACLNSPKEFREVEQSSLKWGERKHKLNQMIHLKKAENRSLIRDLKNYTEISKNAFPSDCPVHREKEYQTL